MTEKDMLIKLHEIVKTPYNECMILPFGNNKPSEVIKWIKELNEEEFNLLMSTPIIVQAKIFYKKLRQK